MPRMINVGPNQGRETPLHRLGSRSPNLWLLLFLLPLLVALAACAGPTTGANATDAATPVAMAADGTQEVTIQAIDAMRFTPGTIVVRAGHPVRLTLKNDGSMVHDFTLTDGVTQPVKLVAQPGESASATFTIEHPGTYTFSCSQPLHQIRGMQGTITVQ
ncbi:MAG TPA: cupredoxin domain-containing protein [Chloroflexota bacterium]|nr:cupredoxin domain-containing protein [Chloroflexota bacterium]